jgi:hypothetical protein
VTTIETESTGLEAVLVKESWSLRVVGFDEVAPVPTGLEGSGYGWRSFLRFRLARESVFSGKTN